MSKVLYVENLHKNTSQAQIMEQFSRFGEVSRVNCIESSLTAVVLMAKEEDGLNAIRALDNTTLGENKIIVTSLS